MSSTIINRFGLKLRRLRCQRNLTLKELAIALGYTSHGYISELESGKKTPTVEFTVNVSRFFDVTTDQLLKDEIELPSRLAEEEVTIS
ncbi:MAG: helix-turn-helix domain-containing protein [Janthinobacterium lividum]